MTVGSPDTKHLPWAKPDLAGREREYVDDALTSTWVSGGPYVDRLEREVGGYCGAPHALAVANGTVAIHLAYLAIGLKPGDEVVIPGFAFLAAANVALHMGARPVFAEVDPHTWCLTAEAIEKVLTPRTRAVVPVHTYGNACDMDPIMALCRPRKIWVIEDAAESFGTRSRGKMTGTIGDLGTLSFQATKTITTGEGGMVLTNHPDLVQTMKLYRSHGMLKTRYLHELPGLNFRLTNMQAAVGCAQFERLPSMIESRRHMIERYRESLANLPGVALQRFEDNIDPVVWAIGVKLDAADYPQGRDAVIGALETMGIETRPGFYPPSAMRELYGEQAELPICDDVSRQVISLPSFPTLTAAEIGHVCAALGSLRRGA